jgi:hypothetical protein
MQKTTPEQDRSAYAASVKRRIARMREKLGMGHANATNENGAPKQEGKAPSELQPPRSRPLGTIG